MGLTYSLSLKGLMDFIVYRPINALYGSRINVLGPWVPKYRGTLETLYTAFYKLYYLGTALVPESYVWPSRNFKNWV